MHCVSDYFLMDPFRNHQLQKGSILEECHHYFMPRDNIGSNVGYDGMGQFKSVMLQQQSLLIVVKEVSHLVTKVSELN